MTSSRDPAPRARARIAPLPAGLPSMWRLCKLGYRHEPGLLLAAFVLSLLAALPDALLALWFKLLADAVLARDAATLLLVAIALGASTAATWLLRTISTRVQRRFRDKVTIALEAHVARLQATISTIAHQERPEYLDRLSVLRNQVFVLDHMYMSVFATCGWMLRLGVTIGLLVTVHPALALLALFAVPTVVTSAWRPGIERRAQERGAPALRLARHLFNIATTAAAGKEIRVAGIESQLIRDRRASWEYWYGPVAKARWGSALWHAGAWAIFGAAHVAAIVLVAGGGQAAAGDVLLVLAAGARLSAYIGATVGEVGFLRGIWMDGAQRLAWLEDYAASQTPAAGRAAPAQLVRSIRFDHVSFQYPGTNRVVLDDVTLDLPAGKVVALVGENGAGKTTLVKLLTKMYEPTSGRILIDDVELAHIRADTWREKVSGAFQDFFRFELRARQTVGVGDLPRCDDEHAVGAAVSRAGADDVVQRLAQGLSTQLGSTWPGGVDVSFGQWQKLALARGFMPEAPLLLVLDEPTAALDAETEHALFERYAAAARFGPAPAASAAEAVGRITVLVSHRFSTVRMADLIVVLDGARVAEVGTHDELMARRGMYAELYGIQAASYVAKN